MNPYRHEIQHLLRSKAVIAVVIVGVIAGTFGYLAISQAASQVAVSGSGFWYSSDGTYHVEVWGFDNAGEPVSGLQVDLTVTTMFYLGGPPPTVLYNETLSSDAQGRVQFTVTPATANYSASIRASDPAVPAATTNGAFGEGFQLTDSPTEEVNSLGTPLNTVAQNFYSDQPAYLLIWAGPDGAPPSDDQAIYCTFETTISNYSVPYPSNCTGYSGVTTQLLGPISGYRTLLPIPATTSPPVVYPQIFFQFVEVTNATGGVLYSTSVGSTCFGQCSLQPIGLAQSPGPQVLASFADELSFFLPLMGLLVAYWSYARPRLTGTLEPVIVRPVTRRGIFFARYGTVAFALLVATIAEVLLLDLGVTAILHEPLPASFLAPLVGGLAVAAIGFAGLVFLSAHVLRSSGAVLGLGIGLVLLFSLFWEVVVILALFSLGFSSNFAAGPFQEFVLRSQLLAPPQFPLVVTGILTSYATFGISSEPYAAAGVTALVVEVAAVLWLVVPFLLTYWRAVHRD